MRKVNKLLIPVAVLLLLFSFMRRERHAAPVPQKSDSIYVPPLLIPEPLPGDTLRHCGLSSCGGDTYRLSLPPGAAIQTSVL